MKQSAIAQAVDYRTRGLAFQRRLGVWLLILALMLVLWAGTLAGVGREAGDRAPTIFAVAGVAAALGLGAMVFGSLLVVGLGRRLAAVRDRLRK